MMEDHIQLWIIDLLKSLEISLDETTITRVLEHCGRACARRGNLLGMIEKLKKRVEDSGDIDSLLHLMNQHQIGSGMLRREGKVITAVYKECLCPLRKEIPMPPIFCHCTKGWAKEMCEAILGQTVDVELVKAIGWGDPVCEYRVTIR
jgi:predicted hydrocarbon binding protein